MILFDRQLACVLSPRRCSNLAEAAVDTYDRKYHSMELRAEQDRRMIAMLLQGWTIIEIAVEEGLEAEIVAHRLVEMRKKPG